MAILALKPRLVESGKIKIGGKSTQGKPKKSGKGLYYPTIKYDEFHVTTMQKDPVRDAYVDDVPIMWMLRAYNASPEQREVFDRAPDKRAKAEAVKDVKITRIPVILHTDHMDDVLEHDLTCYLGLQRHKVCNGVVCTRYEVRRGPHGMEATGSLETMACECPKSPNGFVSPRFWNGQTPETEDKICKPTGILRCMIAVDIAGTGIYAFRTTGWNSLAGLTGALKRLRDDCAGRLANIPCELVLYKTKGKDKNGRVTTVIAVNLIPLESVRERLLALKEDQALRASIRQLPQRRPAIEGEVLAPQTASFASEFFPEAEPEIFEAEYDQRPNDEGDAPPFDDVNRDPESIPSCVDCGEVTMDVRKGPDGELRCESCDDVAARHSEQKAAAEPEPQAEKPAADKGAALTSPIDGDARTDVELRYAVTHAWRDYATRCEHPDGTGALYRGVCEAAGFDSTVQLESAARDQLHTMETFLLRGIALLKGTGKRPTLR